MAHVCGVVSPFEVPYNGTLTRLHCILPAGHKGGHQSDTTISERTWGGPVVVALGTAPDFQNVTGKKLRQAAQEVGSILKELVDGDIPMDHDRTFVADMREKWKQYGEGLVVSPRQLFWLRDIRDKQMQVERITRDDGDEEC